MLNKLHTQNKNPQKLSSVFCKTPARGMFEPRSLVIQQKQQDDSQQPDLKTSLKQAEKYGHHPNQIQSANISSNATPVQPKTGIEQLQLIQPKFKWPWSKKKTTTPAMPAPTDWSHLAKNEFKPGDKLYGLAHARPQGAVTGVGTNQGKATVIDELNNQFLGTKGVGNMSKTMGPFAKDNPTNQDSQKWMNDAKYGEPNKAAKTPEQRQEALDYQKWLEKHPKYSPITTNVRGEPLSSPFRQWDRTKKSSKAGLEYITKEKQNKVHFVLDDINQETVVKKLDYKGRNPDGTLKPEQKIADKTKDSQQGITASELRSLYRKQGDRDLMSNVQFWEGGQQVPAPWKTNPKLWSQYKPKSWGGNMLPPPIVNTDLQKDFNAATANI